jgi:ABC-type multidrug transport system ATPase subunit
VIRFEGFGKRYGRQRAVLRLDLEVRRGEVVALLGPNGSGKSTALKAAAGLVRPTEGRVRVGEPLRPADHPEARRSLSFLPQKVAFPEALTGREVVEFYRRLRGAAPERGRDVLAMAALDGAAGRPVGTYSGGMVQRLGLAVVALPDAPLLILDEPTSSLDRAGLAAAHALAEQSRREGHAVLFSTHQLAEVEQLADRIAILVDGALVASLDRTELSARLARRGILRLVVARVPDGLADAVARVAPGAVVEHGEIVVTGPAAVRAAAVEVVRASGAELRRLSSEEGRLDVLYQELVDAAAPGAAGVGT